MSFRKLFLAIFRVVALSAFAASVGAQVTEQAGRDQARNLVRSQLHLKPDQFLQVHRDEELEQSLAVIVGKPGVFVYRLSRTGDEIKEQSVVHHIFTDAESAYIVAVRADDASMYSVHGFTDSRAEFERLMTTSGPRVASSEQAQSIVDFYRDVNPENWSMPSISSLLDLKQAAERQCQTVPFDPNEKDFEAWWRHARPLYADVPFRETARPSSDNGYLVEWIVLSAPGSDSCGGAPLRATLKVGSNGEIGKLTLLPVRSK
ncbi:MAG: hypothetical protein JWO19_1377 [Bryobacterales bacterium]|nr:hypothetical protein [Bryobacterales bacterium]